MRLIRRALLAGALALAATAAHAQGADPNRLFADSKLVVRDRFSVEVVGKGPDVVFIPGLASSRETWKATAERLRGRYRLHLIQIAGFAGEPPRANADGDVVVPTAEAIAAYLADQKLAPATVVGHSLGGATAMYLAQNHPTRLKRAMIVDAMPFFGGMRSAEATVESVRPQAVRLRDLMLAQAGQPRTAQSLLPQMATMSKDPAMRLKVAEWGARSDPSVVARALYDMNLLDLRPGLPAVRVPIVLVHPDNIAAGAAPGMMDGVYRAAYAPAKTVSVRRVDQSIHFVMHDNPEAFAAVLDDFLKH